MKAAETIGNASTGTYVFMLVLGLVWAAWPLVTLTNFRGFRDRHRRRALRGQERLRRLPPYRWLPRSDPESDERFAAVMQNVVAAVFLVAATLLVVVGIVGLARRLTGD